MNRKHRSAIRAAGAALSVIAVLWVVACGALYHVMEQSPERFAHVMAKMPGPVPFLILPFETLWTHARAGTLATGDHAPDFTLTKLDKSEQIQLSSLTASGKPVVLVFGSYT